MLSQVYPQKSVKELTFWTLAVSSFILFKHFEKVNWTVKMFDNVTLHPAKNFRQVWAQKVCIGSLIIKHVLPSYLHSKTLWQTLPPHSKVMFFDE